MSKVSQVARAHWRQVWLESWRSKYKTFADFSLMVGRPAVPPSEPGPNAARNLRKRARQAIHKVGGKAGPGRG